MIENTSQEKMGTRSRSHTSTSRASLNPANPPNSRLCKVRTFLPTAHRKKTEHSYSRAVIYWSLTYIFRMRSFCEPTTTSRIRYSSRTVNRSRKATSRRTPAKSKSKMKVSANQSSLRKAKSSGGIRVCRFSKRASIWGQARVMWQARHSVTQTLSTS